MADNVAGQTRTNSDKQDSPAIAQGKVVFDATAITATDSTRVLTGFKPRWTWRKNSSGSLMSGVACAWTVTLMLTPAGP